MRRCRAHFSGLLPAIAAILLVAACGGDDDGAGPESGGSDIQAQESPDDGTVGGGVATAELTVDDVTYSFQAYTGCIDIDDGTGFLGSGAGPAGQAVELNVAYYADPPASDLPGANWTLTAVQDGDTPGIATGEDLWMADPGLLRTDGDGFEVESDGSMIRIAGPAEPADGGDFVDSEVVVTCG